jgi:hypothetical protein
MELDDTTYSGYTWRGVARYHGAVAEYLILTSRYLLYGSVVEPVENQRCYHYESWREVGASRRCSAKLGIVDPLRKSQETKLPQSLVEYLYAVSIEQERAEDNKPVLIAISIVTRQPVPRVRGPKQTLVNCVSCSCFLCFVSFFVPPSLPFLLDEEDPY